MVVALHDPQRVALQVLACHVPRIVVGSAALALVLDAADAEALALAERVEAQAHVPAEHTAAFIFNRPGLVAQVAVEELAERPLADEADAGGVFLRSNRQAD